MAERSGIEWTDATWNPWRGWYFEEDGMHAGRTLWIDRSKYGLIEAEALAVRDALNRVAR